MISPSKVLLIALIVLSLYSNVRCAYYNNISEHNERVIMKIRPINWTPPPVWPKECQDLGICENVPSYPEKKIKNIIKNLEEKGLFPSDIEYCSFEGNVQNFKDSRPLCESNEKCITPRAIMSRDGVWHLALNSGDADVPKQTFVAQICTLKSRGCSRVLKNTYGSSCHQVYLDRPVVVLNGNLDAVVVKFLPVPRCCKCHVPKDY